MQNNNNHGGDAQGQFPDSISDMQLLLNCIEKISRENAIGADYERINTYLRDIPPSEFDTEEKRIRKAKFVLNKQVYEKSMERNGPHPLMKTPEFMDAIGSIWNFSRAGQCFVMPHSSRGEKK